MGTKAFPFPAVCLSCRFPPRCMSFLPHAFPVAPPPCRFPSLRRAFPVAPLSPSPPSPAVPITCHIPPRSPPILVAYSPVFPLAAILLRDSPIAPVASALVEPALIPFPSASLRVVPSSRWRKRMLYKKGKKNDLL